MHDFSTVEKRLGVTFRDKRLLQEALTHRSYLNENRSWPVPHNEHLEFLGDAVIELVITDHLLQRFGRARSEGELTKLRSFLVNNFTLAQIAASIHLPEHLFASRGQHKELRQVSRVKERISACLFEAVIGAIYVDQGLEVAKLLLERVLLSRFNQLVGEGSTRDAKSLLQEEAQQRRRLTPRYKTLSERGPDHAKQFVVGVYFADEFIAQGDAPSKRHAQVRAAEQALHVLGW